MPSKRQQLFAELGLMDTPEPVNPYASLGLSPEMAQDLLKEDDSGDALKIMTGSMAKILSRRYHPDVPNTGSRDRFTAIDDANKRIDAADSGTLRRWAVTERPTSSAQTDKLKAQQQELMSRATGLIQAEFDGSQHPTHHSRLMLAQGVLLERNATPLLLRQADGGGLSIARGQRFISKASQARGADTQAFNFQDFLRRHDSFGIEPNTPVTAYIDEAGRSTILGANLSFLMDITGPVGKHRDYRKSLSHQSRADIGSSDSWTRHNNPVMLATITPTPKSRRRDDTIITNFPNVASSTYSQPMERRTPLEVAGSIADPNFYTKVKHTRAVGAAAISGAAASNELSYFNIVTVPARSFVEHDSGYTPLVAPGNSILLYDTASNMPVVTDAKIIGMIGSNSYSR